MGERKESLRNDASRISIALALSLALIAGIPIPAAAYHDEIVDKLEHGVTERVSVNSFGTEGNGDSGVTSNCGSNFSGSDDGRRIAFASLAGNLHPADVNGSVIQDIFVYNRNQKNLDLVSALPTGHAWPSPPGDINFNLCTSARPAISGNGRFVAFSSTLPLAGEDIPGAPTRNVYVRDLKKSETELVSNWSDYDAAGSVGATSGAYSIAISDDGRFVTFDSVAASVTSGDACISIRGASLCSQIYVRDREYDRTILVSKSSEGDSANGDSLRADISGNGRFVVYESVASNLVLNDGNSCPVNVPTAPSCWDVFRHDLETGKTDLVSVSRDGGSADGGSIASEISDDGRFAVFYSNAKDLVPANISLSPFCGGVYLRDLERGRTERVSVTSTGTMLGGGSVMSSISDSGRYVAWDAFQDHGNPLSCWPVPSSETHEYGGSFLDRTTGQVDRRTFFDPDAADGAGPDGTRFQVDGFQYMEIGGNARFVVGASGYSNMVVNDTNDSVDVFVRDLDSYPLGSSMVRPRGASSLARSGQNIILIGNPRPQLQRVAKTKDAGSDAFIHGLDAEILEARISLRPSLDDLFVRIDVDRLANGESLSSLPETLTLYGARITTEDKTYELRAQAFGGAADEGGGRFGLFECSQRCVEIAKLKGGYGTVGETIVASIPLEALGLSSGGEIRDLEVFTAMGSYNLGPTKVLDTVTFEGPRPKRLSDRAAALRAEMLATARSYQRSRRSGLSPQAN